ncbi:MAG: hypothetical protein EKK61_04190 [Rickettsiales bacterium]|nr:MAG: hypothetical protein EKK61_04190 [Rickettsiales bacterium]
MLGVEIVEVPSLADGTIIFGDLYHYAIGDRKTVSIEAGYYGANWASDIKSLKACERIAGKVKFADAFSILEAA